MAGHLNRAQLLGNVGRDPEIRSTNSGTRIANFSLATSQQWRDRTSGEKKERTEWHRCVVFAEGLVDIVEKYVRKGDKLYVEGEIQTREWTDNAGVKKFSTEIVLKPFGGIINLLTERRGGAGGSRGADPDYGDAYEGGGDRGGGGNGYDGRREGGPASGSGAAAPRRRNDDLDDEIPF